ncbi:MAG: transglycosylase SLT domain-containing protein [Gammaproteobacteria bacterium]
MRRSHGARPWRALTGLTLLALLAVACSPAPADTFAPPRAALAYQRDLTREAHAAWGLSAPVPVFAAQVHQESAWRADARSPVGAQGLAQFMPATARWMAELYPNDLEGVQPWNPRWALRAMVRYDGWLHRRVEGRTACDRWWFVLRAYNGGLGHVLAEKRLAADPFDRMSVDAQCGLAKRAALHCRENLGYPLRILLRHQRLYAAWGPPVGCDD